MEHQVSLTVALVFLVWETQCASVRLVPANASMPHKGRLEIFLDGVWGTVCDDFFKEFEARVICRQLNYSGVVQVLYEEDVEPGTGPIHLDDVHCSCGNESSLLECEHQRQSNCGHHEDVGIECRTHFPEREGAVQLVGGNSSAGRVEVFINDEWGTISDTNWGSLHATAVCNQLGFAGVSLIPPRKSYPPGVGRIWKLCQNCTPVEENEPGLITDYLITEGCKTDAAHFHDAAVVCSQELLEIPTTPIDLTSTTQSQISTEIGSDQGTNSEVPTAMYNTEEKPTALISSDNPTTALNTVDPSLNVTTALATALTMVLLAFIAVVIILSGVTLMALRLVHRYKEQQLSTEELFAQNRSTFTIIQNN